jgi:hypothetical protein
MSQPTKRILHIDFNLADLNHWMEGKSHAEIGRVLTAIGLAAEADDEPYLEQYPFIDRIVYGDGSMRKIIRSEGPLDMGGIDRPISKEDKPKIKAAVKRGTTSRKGVQLRHS